MADLRPPRNRHIQSSRYPILFESGLNQNFIVTPTLRALIVSRHPAGFACLHFMANLTGSAADRLASSASGRNKDAKAPRTVTRANRLEGGNALSRTLDAC